MLTLLQPSRRPILIRDFSRDAALLKAFNQRRIGLRTVPVSAVTGTVGRTDLLSASHLSTWMKTIRFRSIEDALAGGECLPPIELYLLAGHYYIRDGHHRVLAARRVGILDVDADVIECLPSHEWPAAAWHRARMAFEVDTGLIGLHVRRQDGYELLRRQIAEHAWYLGENGQAPRSFSEAARRWEREVFQLVVDDLARRGLLDPTSDLTAPELYLAVCDHKWYRSERSHGDVGFSAAVASYARYRRHPRLHRLIQWLDEWWVEPFRLVEGLPVE